MKKYIHILTKCPVFSGINEEELLTMLSCMDAQIYHFSKNQTILRAGDPAKYMGIVLSGRVQVIRDAICGSRSIIADFGPPQLFGAAFACAAVETLPVSVIAMLDSEILLIDCKKILTVCSNSCVFHAKLISNLLKIVSDRNIFFNQKLDVVTKRTTRGKLLSFLFTQSRQAGSRRFTISYNRQQLADYLGVNRSAMITELTKLKEDHVIAFHRNEFEILQMQ
ncbi:MAG: Crp/Fnr family transcriptional regulator, partial [Clostridia bacterium]|nr:Crp/Fnr family transcriptional regulator [Clostridia bacterium]